MVNVVNWVNRTPPAHNLGFRELYPKELPTPFAKRAGKMWLRKDERRLLAGYFHNRHMPGTGEEAERWYSVNDLRPLLRNPKTKIPESHDVDPQLDYNLLETNRIKLANNHLADRKLITLKPHETQDSVGIELTTAGDDLGRRYSHWFTWSDELFQEYRDHWLWLIFTFVCGYSLRAWVGD